jgi:tRNA/tmRNA/rRNA uracil-C5-methylase (TrmA/RlmC/RlmD family)
VSRRTRARSARGLSRVGERHEVEVGPVAHGGHCVARLEDGRVVFVRHALPGERVEVEVTEGTDGDPFWRADAVAVLTTSSDRVEAPCPVAGPGLCGGCDFQHVALARQRSLKADVVAEQLRRLAGLSLDVVVEAVPGDVDGLRWRTRTRFARLPDGRTAMRKHRSHELVPVDDCLIALPPAPSGSEVVEAAGRSHTFQVASDGFWQVHPGAPRVLVETVLSLLNPQVGERVLDLYAGVGLFAAFFADVVGPSRVVAVEGHPGAARDAVANLPRGVRVERGDVARVLTDSLDEPFDLVVLDPPREGARRKVVEQVVDRAPRAVAYVACDPAALARDVATFASRGYVLREVRAFDLFPMTHHVECVAVLVRQPSGSSGSSGSASSASSASSEA